MTQWWLTTLCREELLYFWQFKRQALLGYGVRYTVLIVDWERLTPITLTAEDCIAQTVVYLHAAKTGLSNELLCLCYSFLYCKTVEVKFAVAECCCWRVCHYTLFGIKTLFGNITTLNKRAYLNTEVLCKCIVTAVVCRNSHNGTGSVACKYIITYPNRNLLTCNRVDSI